MPMRSLLIRVLCSLVLLGAGVARAEEEAPPAEEAAPAAEGAEAPATDAAPAQEGDAQPEAQPAAEANPDNPDKGDAENIRLGELSNMGSSKLGAHDTRFGIRAGVAKIGGAYYLAGSFELDLAIKRFALGLGTPVNLVVYDSSKGLKLFPNGMKLRAQDYQGIYNYVKFIRYLTYGVKEGAFYLNLSTQGTVTIGHGDAVRRFVPNIDVDHTVLSAELDAKFKYGGLESFIGDVLHPNRLVGGLLYLKPFGFADSIFLQRFSVGLSYAADFTAPYKLQKDINGIPVLTASTDHEPFVPKVAESRQLHIVGLSVESKIVRTENVDIKPYVYANQMIVSGGPTGTATQKLGTGGAIGFLGRFGFGDHGRHALRLVGEGRDFQNNYEPGYFDTFYSIQRYQYFGPNDNPAQSATKLFDMMSRDPNGPKRVGFYGELQYAYSDLFAITAAYEDSSAKNGQNLILHLEVPAFEYVRFFGTIYRSGIASFGDVTKSVSSQLKADNTVYFAGARVKLLPILFVNLRAYRSWQMDQANTNNSYRNVTGFQADLEVGYEFSRNKQIQQ